MLFVSFEAVITRSNYISHFGVSANISPRHVREQLAREMAIQLQHIDIYAIITIQQPREIFSVQAYHHLLANLLSIITRMSR